MNLILFESQELTGGELRLTDRRAAHIARVIRPEPGAHLRVGVIGGATGAGQVLAVGEAEVVLRVTLDGPRPKAPQKDLVLALPRPKVLCRLLRTVGALGVGRLDLVNSWRVDKSYFQSPVLEPDTLRRHLLEGAEQGATTWLPKVTVFPRLMLFFEQHQHFEEK